MEVPSTVRVGQPFTVSVTGRGNTRNVISLYFALRRADGTQGGLWVSPDVSSSGFSISYKWKHTFDGTNSILEPGKTYGQQAITIWDGSAWGVQAVVTTIP
jgi:hypothetical protein